MNGTKTRPQAYRCPSGHVLTVQPWGTTPDACPHCTEGNRCGLQLEAITHRQAGI